MDSTRRKNWASVRGKGKVRFIILYWIIGWGITGGAIASIVTYFVRSSLNKSYSVSNLWSILKSNLIMFPIMGLFLGLLVWWDTERRFKRLD